MKTITSLSFLAALATALLAPISLELAGSLLLATGMAAIFAADYTRKARLTSRRLAPVITLAPTPRRAATPAALELAA